MMELDSVMSVEEAILEAVHNLPLKQQEEMLEHGVRLRDERAELPPPMKLRGLLADLNINVSAEEIDENQRELWRGFSRDDI